MKKSSILKSLTPLQTFTLLLSFGLLMGMGSMPYGYYTFLRISVVALGLVWLVKFIDEGRDYLKYITIGVILLFQPIFKISLGRDVWSVINLFLAISLVALVVKRVRKKKG